MGGQCLLRWRLSVFWPSHTMDFSSAKVILTQIKVCLAAIMGRWRQVRDMETTPTPLNPFYVSLDDGWRPLKQWIDVLTAPHTNTPGQTGPTGSSKFGGSEAGLGLVWPPYNGVRNVADHLKSLHTCPKLMTDAFYNGGCPFFGCLVKYYWPGNGIFGPN